MKTKNLFVILTIFFSASCENKNEIDLGTDILYEDLIRTKIEIMNMERPKDSYNYPVYPGMEEWKRLSSGQEMAEACQVPPDKLKTMSTQAVIQALWEYPLLFEVFHRYQYQMDFESVFLPNNAYNELKGRTDAGTSLLKRLEVVNPLVSEAKFEFEILELLMAQDVFLSQLGEKDKKTTIELALKKDDLRQQNVNYADKPERSVLWLFAGKIMLNAGYKPLLAEINRNDQLKSFLTLNTYVYMKEIYGDDIPQIIIQYATTFIQTSNLNIVEGKEITSKQTIIVKH
jgi:hypothetical protein